MTSEATGRLSIAVVGSGISGLSAAWLLAKRHRVTLYEASARLGGHSNTVEAEGADGEPIGIDTGFIVFNPPAYPNLTALLAHLGVPTEPTDMSLSVRVDGDRLEYGGQSLSGLFAQRSNLVNPRFWSMLADLVRFYRQGRRDAGRDLAPHISLGEYLDDHGFGQAFRDDHLLPMAAAIWSAEPERMLSYPAATFLSFCQNHGLLNLGARPPWRTITGGSRRYVERLAATLGPGVRLASPVARIERYPGGVAVVTRDDRRDRFDHVVLATHADQSLRMLDAPSTEEKALLGTFTYSRNHTVLHRDTRVMPSRRAVWSSWNVERTSTGAETGVRVTYWMNRLQNIADPTEYFVTLNPAGRKLEGVMYETHYDHPIFDRHTLVAQRRLWSLQGHRNTWYCGAHFGAGFHEDGLQSGLAVAEALGGVRRPWSVPLESARIWMSPTTVAPSIQAAA